MTKVEDLRPGDRIVREYNGRDYQLTVSNAYPVRRNGRAYVHLVCWGDHTITLPVGRPVELVQPS